MNLVVAPGGDSGQGHHKCTPLFGETERVPEDGDTGDKGSRGPGVTMETDGPSHGTIHHSPRERLGPRLPPPPIPVYPHLPVLQFFLLWDTVTGLRVRGTV